MKRVIAKLEGISPYSQSQVLTESKSAKESHEDFEQRIWRSRLHVDAKGMVYIPPTAFKNALSEAAKFLSIQIPGSGKATYTKHFEAGVLCADPVPLGIAAKEVEGERLFLPASGKRGDGKRVWKTYPRINEWTGEVIFHVVDETVLQTHRDTEMTVFEHVLTQAGSIIGLGRFRPRNNGYYGRFIVTDFQVVDA